MTHASLFSGIGGAEIAAEMMGWSNAFHCEINPFGRKVLHHHFPQSKSYEDITTTDFSHWRGKIDILTGGFPCQPFSSAGKRRGALDDRYLWPHMLRAIREIQPTWIVGENVAGLLSMVQPSEEIEMGSSDTLFEENYIAREEQEYTIERICNDLEREGYSVQSFIIPACAVGAPHRRDRVWIVAHAISKRCQGRRGITEKRNESKEIGASILSDTCGFTAKQSTPNSHSERPSRGKYKRERHLQSRLRPQTPNSSQVWRKWQDFPTQSPICRGNDGLPCQLDTSTISYPKWRKESLKAYGNAIVPQVIYEIFKAMEQVTTIQ